MLNEVNFAYTDMLDGVAGVLARRIELLEQCIICHSEHRRIAQHGHGQFLDRIHGYQQEVERARYAVSLTPRYDVF